jgi:hypothetical protein
LRSILLLKSRRREVYGEQQAISLEVRSDPHASPEVQRAALGYVDALVESREHQPGAPGSNSRP